MDLETIILVAEIGQEFRRKHQVDGVRFSKALGIVYARRVRIHPELGWVCLSDEQHSTLYRVNGSCECADYTLRGTTWCKHLIATTIAKQVRRILIERQNARMAAVAQPAEAV